MSHKCYVSHKCDTRETWHDRPAPGPARFSVILTTMPRAGACLWDNEPMTTETTDGRLRDLEAEAFRTGRTLAEHSTKLTEIETQQRTAFSNIDSLGDAIGAPGERSIMQRLDSIEGDLSDVKTELGDVKRLLSALVRAQGLDPDQA